MEGHLHEAVQMSCETQAHTSIGRRPPVDLKSVVGRANMPKQVSFGRTPSTKEIQRLKLSPQQETYWNYVLHMYAESRCIYFTEDRLSQLHKHAVVDSKVKETDTKVMRSIFEEVYAQIGDHMQFYHSVHKKRIEESLKIFKSELSYHVLRHRPNDERAKSQDEFVNLLKRLSRFVAPNPQDANHHHLDSLPSSLRDNFSQILSWKLQELQIEAKKADGTIEFVNKRLNELMKSISGPPFRTVREIRTIFHSIMKLALNDIESIARERRYPEVWDAAKWVLILQIKVKLRETLVDNTIQMKQLDRTFEKALENCSDWYHEELESHKTLFQDEQHRVAISNTEAKFRAFCENIRIEPAICKYWWKCLKIMMDKWGAKHDKPMVISENPCKSSSKEDCTKLLNNPFACRVAIYLSENVFQMSTKLPDGSLHSVKYAPFISVENDAIRMIEGGKALDATKNQSYFNIYQVINSLPNPQRRPQKLGVRGKSIDVSHNEAVVLFFHQLKKKIEMKNPIEYDKCVVLFSSLFPASARQCLTAVLSIIGFGKVEFLPLAVTAAFMDHRDSTVKAARPYSMLFLLQTGTLFEASKVKVSADVIEVTQTEGYYNVEQAFDGFMSLAVQKVRNMLDDKKKGLKDIDQVILLQLDRTLESAVENIKRCFQPTKIVNRSEQLISIAVEIPAHGNDKKSFPRYSDLVPSYLSVKNSCFKFTKDDSITKSLGKHKKGLTVFQTPSSQRCSSPSQFHFFISHYGDDKTEKCEIEMTMAKSGCFTIDTHNDRSSISCPSFKFLTKQDLNDLKNTYEIFKNDFDSNVLLITATDP